MGVGVPAPGGVCTADSAPRPRIQGLGDVGPLTIFDGDLVLNLCQPNDQLRVRGPLRVSQCTRILLTLCDDGATPTQPLDILNELIIEDSRGPNFNAGPRIILQNIPTAVSTQDIRIPFATFNGDEINVDIEFPEVPGASAETIAASNEIQNGVWDIVLAPRPTADVANVNTEPVCQTTGYSIGNNLPTGSSLGLYTATDPDTGATVTYTEATGETAPFDIVTNAGQNTATITTTLPNITPGQYNYDIVVSDGFAQVNCVAVITVNTVSTGSQPVSTPPTPATPIVQPTVTEDDSSNHAAWIVPVSVGVALLFCCCLGLLLLAFLRNRREREYSEDPMLYGCPPPAGLMTGTMPELDFTGGMVPCPTPTATPVSHLE